MEEGRGEEGGKWWRGKAQVKPVACASQDERFFVVVIVRAAVLVPPLVTKVTAPGKAFTGIIHWRSRVFCHLDTWT